MGSLFGPSQQSEIKVGKVLVTRCQIKINKLYEFENLPFRRVRL